ncbi:MAG: site-specific integrase, partial [Planctomycetota bacterium]
MARLTKLQYRDAKTGLLREVAKYYCDMSDANGKRVRVPLSTNKEAAKVLMADLIKQRENHRAGISNFFTDSVKVPLSKHLADWACSLESTADKGGLTTRRVRRIFEEVGAAFLPDLIPSRIMEALARLAKRTDMSFQSQNHYMGAIKQFERWLEKDGRISSCKLKHLCTKQVLLDKRHERRAFDPLEAEYLINNTQDHGVRLGGLSGEDRAWLYRLALTTGLRAKELWSLCPDAFQSGFVTLKAVDSKNRNGGRLPIPEALAPGLAEWLATKPAGRRLFDGYAIAQKSGIVCTSAFSRNLKKDMAQARKLWLTQGGAKESDFLQYKDSGGQYADFHAMRVSAITWAVADGANPKLVQALARHSTITLTMDRYCKAPKAAELVGISNGLGEKLMSASAREVSVWPSICQNFVQTGDNQKIRLISNETIPAKVDPSKTARKQAFGGVLSRKKEEGPPGFEPGNNGFAN